MSTEERHSFYPATSGFTGTIAGSETLKRSELPRNHEWMQVLGFDLDFTPQVITFNNWDPAVWNIVGTNGAVLVTISEINVTVTKAQDPSGHIVVVYNFQANVAVQWSVNKPGDLPRYSGELRLEFRNNQGGVVWWDTVYLTFDCGTNNLQSYGKRFGLDVFDQISGAHLSANNQTYWKC